MADTEAEARELLSAAALYDPKNLEPLGSRAFVLCGSPLKRWSQITQEERRAWMQGAGFGYAAGKAEGERIGEAKGLRRAAQILESRKPQRANNRDANIRVEFTAAQVHIESAADELEGSTRE